MDMIIHCRRHYGLSVARTFNDLFATHSHDVVNGLKEAYTSVEDIELYIGGKYQYY